MKRIARWLVGHDLLATRIDELELQVWRLEAIAEQSAVLKRWEGSR